MLPNAYFLAKFRFDTAENEPAKNSQNFAKTNANFANLVQFEVRRCVKLERSPHVAADRLPVAIDLNPDLDSNKLRMQVQSFLPSILSCGAKVQNLQILKKYLNDIVPQF